MAISNKVKGILSVIGGFALYFIFGTVYSWSATNAYYISYLINTGHVNVQIKNGFFFMPTIWIAQYLTMAPGLKIADCITVRGSVILSTICLASSFIFLLFFFNFIIVMMSMILFGIGIGLGFLVIVKNIWKYNDTHAGLANGIILSGVGVSSAILNPLADLLINPDKTKPNSEGIYPSIVSDNIPLFFYTLLIIYACLGAIGILFTIPYSPDSKTYDIVVESESQIKEPINCDYKQGLFSSKTLQLSVFCFCVPFFGMLIPNIARTYGNLNNLDQLSLQILTFTFSSVNAVLRFPWGYIYDKIGFKQVLYVIILLQLVVASSIYFVASNIYLYFFENILIAVAISGIYVVMPPTYKQIFGSKNGTDIYGVSSILIGVATVVGAVLTQFILKDNNLQNYLIVFICSAVIILIGLVNLIYFKVEPFVYLKAKEATPSIHETGKLIPDSNIEQYNS